MTFIRSVAWTLLAGVGFALALPPTAPARQDKDKKDEQLPRRPGGAISEVSNYRQAGLPNAEVEKAKKTFATYAEYQAALIASPVVYRATLDFRPEAIRHIAELAYQVNEKTENIGARRLYTVLEKLLEQISFDAGKRGAATVTIDAAYVDAKLEELAKNEDLARFVL